MIFQITHHCSLQCPHCCVYGAPDNKHASTLVIERTIKLVKELTPAVLMISGGEPTEHPNFIELFEYILRRTEGYVRGVVMLATNGHFLRDERLIDQLAKLGDKYSFSIQISALKGLYPKRDETISLFKKHEWRFREAKLVEEITVLDKIGRAKDHDFSHIEPTYKRQGPNCFNWFNVAKADSVSNLPEMLRLFEARGLFCKPLINYDGTIYAGESFDCVQLGNVTEDTSQSIFEAVKRKSPCGKCGVAFDPTATVLFNMSQFTMYAGERNYGEAKSHLGSALTACSSFLEAEEARRFLVLAFKGLFLVCNEVSFLKECFEEFLLAFQGDPHTIRLMQPFQIALNCLESEDPQEFLLKLHPEVRALIQDMLEKQFSELVK